MLVIEANSAIAPRTRIVQRIVLRRSTMIEPTTAMAEMALVSDISGVCSSRETRGSRPGR